MRGDNLVLEPARLSGVGEDVGRELHLLVQRLGARGARELPEAGVGPDVSVQIGGSARGQR